MELKSCPFCGGEAEMAEVPTFSIGTRYRAGCVSAACPVAPALMGSYGTPEEAAEAWNRRAERTCHDLGGEEDTNYEYYDFGCSECGYACDLPEPRYCPGCGAKVIEGREP